MFRNTGQPVAVLLETVGLVASSLVLNPKQPIRDETRTAITTLEHPRLPTEQPRFIVEPDGDRLSSYFRCSSGSEFVGDFAQNIFVDFEHRLRSCRLRNLGAEFGITNRLPEKIHVDPLLAPDSPAFGDIHDYSDMPLTSTILIIAFIILMSARRASLQSGVSNFKSFNLMYV